MLSSPPRYELEARVLAHEKVIGYEHEIVFHAPPIAQVARPGQFVELLFGSDYAPLLRRPFSLYRVDREAGAFSILYLARGPFTTGLAQKRVGEAVSLLGPLGTPFAWPSAPKTRHILLAGGIGVPPIYFLAQEIAQDLAARGEDPANIVIINGARSKELLVGLVEFGKLASSLIAVTDDGTHGQRGLATEILTALLDAEPEARAATQLYACGPMPMLRAVCQVALARGLPCQVSVETSMPCGIGACQGCAIPVRDKAAPDGFRYALACTDGPIFEARALLWE